MNIEQLRKSGWICFECISGSHAYGTNIEGSDTDIRGVYIQPTEDVMGLKYIPQISDEKNDVIFYEIGRFLELLSKGNPNMMEMINTPEDCVKYMNSSFFAYIKMNKDKFITTKLKHTFTGYAYSQIKKAKGLNKKINWDKNEMTRKDVLDFCYVFGEKEESFRFKKGWTLTGHTGAELTIAPNQDKIGLAKVNNAPDIYSMYYMEENGGIIGEDSNEVQLRSIPKDAPHIGYLRFDRNAYSTHCKDYREYTEWIEKRNPERYKTNMMHGKDYDSKNMMHCFRLLNMAKDIADGKGIVVRRPEREFLLSIRNGEMKYDDILENAEGMVSEIENAFDKSDLPKKVDRDFLHKLLVQIRQENQHGHEDGTAGSVSKKYQIATGRLGCKHCGVTISGAFTENKCKICNKSLI